MVTAALTSAKARALLIYDPSTGSMCWRVHRRKMRPGSSAGTRRPNGYLRVQIDGHLYYAHRLAWLIVYGGWPVNGLDHVNGDRSDNRIVNLRDVPHSINMQNQRKARRDSQSGLLGASPGRCGKWVAQIGHDRLWTRIGTFGTAEEAHSAYIFAKRRLHQGNTL